MKILIVTNAAGDTKGMNQVNSSHIQTIKETGAGLKIESITNQQKNLNQKISSSDILIINGLSVLNPVNSRYLKWVHITSAGTNKIPDFLKSSKTLITNSSGVHPIPISEHVFALILMLSRNIHLAHKYQITQKSWHRSFEEYYPLEIFGKKILIVGMGRIGERIAEISKSFGMIPTGIVRNLDKNRRTKIPLLAIKDLERSVKDADFIINCLPGTDQTKGIFSKKVFSKFKPTAFFINIGRGTTVVEKDLISALEKGKISGAGLDVFEVEPLSPASKLWNLENVIITPHYSGWTPEYTNRVIEIFCKNLKAYLRGAKMPNLVNKELGY